jgi:AmmeMemoRadiSam system protein B
MAAEEGVKTPIGIMEIDRELCREFEKQVRTKPDNYQDNTVEVLLPMVHYFFPRAKLLWLRFPAELGSFEAGKLLAKSAAALKRKLVVLASTDLTHYGRNYGFYPKGFGKAALDWMKEVNDAAFIDAVLGGDPSLILKKAEEDRSACSVGAVLGVLGFTAFNGKTGKKLLDYRTSADLATGKTSSEVPDSFVGYAAISLG